jgi:PTS system beta-glucosides-specific IIC component
MGKYNELANNIIADVGGKENISGLTHCITRLRFILKDDTKADDAALKALNGVVTVMRAGGQVQVVIGNHVPQVYEDAIAITGAIEGGPKAKMNPFDAFIDLISGIFQPFLGVLCAAGMIKGFNALFNFLDWYQQTDGTYIVLNGIGDAVFMFLPVMIGLTAAKKFNMSQMSGLAIGLAMCYPAIQLTAISGAAGEAGPLGQLFGIEGLNYYNSVFGIPFVAGDYTSTVVPVIIVVFLASKVEVLCKKVLPDVIKAFFTPLFAISIPTIAGLLVIGPVVGILTDGLSTAFTNLSSWQPVIFAIILGALWQVLVMFGLHWSLIPIALLNFGTYGYDTVLVGMYTVSFAATAATFAMYFKLKDKQMKSLAIPAIISGIAGVTEPIIYGYTLPNKRPFIFSCVGGAVGGGAVGILGAKGYIMGGLGVFGLPSYIDPVTGDASGMFHQLIGIVVAVAVSFLLTFFFWKDKSQDAAAIESVSAPIHPVTQDQVVIAPVQGKVIPLNEVKDQAFAEGLLGKGVAIEPTKGEVVAPFDGEITAFFPTLHAIGITSSSGLELLIHVGLDTVKLEGKYFQALAKEGDNVKQGQPLLKFDIAGIQEAGYSTQVPIIVTNTPAYTEVIPTRTQIASQETELITALV